MASRGERRARASSLSWFLFGEENSNAQLCGDDWTELQFSTSERTD